MGTPDVAALHAEESAHVARREGDHALASRHFSRAYSHWLEAAKTMRPPGPYLDAAKRCLRASIEEEKKANPSAARMWSYEQSSGAQQIAHLEKKLAASRPEKPVTAKNVLYGPWKGTKKPK